MTAPRVPQDPQDWQDRHLDAGAYVLGVLDEADRVAFEAHLADCPRCAAELDELAGVAGMLGELSKVEPLATAPVGPSPRLLEGLLDEVVAIRRRGRRRRLWLVAAAAVLVVGGPAATVAVLDSGPAASKAPAAAASDTPWPDAPAGWNSTSEPWLIIDLDLTLGL
ncbi:zf-HC2 domain-containing protein, partial [Kitasatospora nipponensis]|uniref:zf-HC2 domain-containing protein n=1 Tax=Kitasatospora nipponensis TaxID=258049 RepID=UPI0031CF8B08